VPFEATSSPSARDNSLASVALLHEFFEHHSACSPKSIAVVCGNVCATYAELDAKANRLARYLRANGIATGNCVGILLPRSPDVYVAMLGILKAGAAYVPLDPEYPSDRVQFILKDCQASMLLTCEALAPRADGFTGGIAVVERMASELETMSAGCLDLTNAAVRPEDLCYVIYTSGTTGRPKGVQIEHRSIVHLVRTEQGMFRIAPGDRVFQGFSIAFDASLEEIWLAFAAGATLVVGTTEMMRAGHVLSELLEEAGVTVLSCVPTLLSMMERDITTIRVLILGGEVCPQELVKRWWKPNRRLFNTYGPTEATVVATCAELFPDQPVTIGRPLPGYEAVIVNDALRIAQRHETGELLIGGVGVARGYVGQPDLTAEKFLSRSFDGGSVGRFYRTGDQVRWNGAGEIEFLGRLDGQVKIRGFRVELSEIEMAMMQWPEIKSAAANLFEMEGGVMQLAAYVVLREGNTFDSAKCTAYLRTRLPAFMIPSVISVVLELPVLPSGKLNRAALPVPLRQTERRQTGLVRTLAESEIVDCWAKLFAIPAVSVTDDFFMDLGGHSLLAARMISELRRRPQFQRISVADLYQYPTPTALAAEVERRAKENYGEQVDSESEGEAPHGGASSNEPSLPFWRHFFCGLAQLLSLVFVLSFFALQWLAPYLAYTILVEEDYSFLTATLGALSSLVLLYPVMLLLVICLKWLIIGRYRAGSYPLWGWYYFRFWLVTSIEATVPVSYLAGSPLLPVYLRLMGARIGKNVFVQTDNFAIYDLLTVGDGSSINVDASLLGYSVSGGCLHIGSVHVGSRAFVGARATLAPNTSMADESGLEELSLLQSGQRIDHGATWLGSPAHLCNPSSDGLTRTDPLRGDSTVEISPLKSLGLAALHTVGLMLFPVLVVGALFPGIVLMNHLNYIDPYYWYLFLSPLVGASFVTFLCLEVVAVKWLLLGKIHPGTYPLNSFYHVRKWFVDKTLELSLDVIGPLYASVYLTPWYKALGATIGRGAEISTASFISPDLLDVGDESFIADNVSLGAPRVSNGVVQLGQNRIGRRSFIGNSALLPPGTVIADDVLIGCLSAPPRSGEGASQPDSAWLGSPALFLQQRLKSHGFGEERTFDPQPHLRVLRATIEFVRVISPSTGFIILTSLLFSALLLLHDHFTLTQTLLFFPALYLGCGLSAAGVTILVKWLLVGRYKPCEKPLWSTFVWRNELINALHEHLASPFLVSALTGTPFMAWYLRLLGARIGRRVYIETTDFSEFDLARIETEAALNSDCTIQTHLFEDRIMKMSVVHVGPRCSVGTGALVLYDTRMEADSKLGPLSLLMKGETLPERTAWAGIPARTCDR
jgi:non-ribosomal peptide synthetase-like protein